VVGTISKRGSKTGREKTREKEGNLIGALLVTGAAQRYEKSEKGGGGSKPQRNNKHRIIDTKRNRR